MTLAKKKKHEENPPNRIIYHKRIASICPQGLSDTLLPHLLAIKVHCSVRNNDRILSEVKYNSSWKRMSL